MKKLYCMLCNLFFIGTVAFAQTNLISNGNFVEDSSEEFWIAQPANSCGASITFDAGVTHTADGSGSWNLNCTNANNRLRNRNTNYFTTVGAGDYTVEVWVQKTGADDGALRIYLGTNNDQTLSNEGDFTVTSTDWTKVTRTFSDLPAATDYFLSFSLNDKVGGTGTDGFRIDDVVVFENNPLSKENFTKEDASVSIVSSDNQITVHTDNKINKLEVYDLLGKTVLTQVGSDHVLSTVSLAKSLYVLKIYGENGRISTKKFLKQ